MEQEITYDQLKKSAEIATNLGDDYSARVLNSMSEKLMKWGKLTLRQTDFARSLIERNSPQAVEAQNTWVSRINSDKELQERIEVVANYYSTTTYFSATCRDFLTWLKEKDNEWLPSERSIMKMIDNKFSNKVWESHKGQQKWNVGDLVQVRQNADIQPATREFWLHRGECRSWVWMVLEADSRPINRAVGYDEKKGGARYYRLLRLGGTQRADVIECELKRVPKKLLK
jgi:sarcosine oxidase delta subunit